MPIPALDMNGLLPEGTHQCTLAEIHESFGNSSPRRQEIFNGLETYLRMLRVLNLPVQVLVDGGFTSRKAEEPEDVDIVIDITGVVGNAFTPEFGALLDKVRMKSTYRVDPTPRHDAFASQVDCGSFFTYIREDLRLRLGLSESFRKGILRLDL